MVTHASSFTVSLICRGRFWHYLRESIWGNAKERGNRCWKVFPQFGAWLDPSSTWKNYAHTTWPRTHSHQSSLNPHNVKIKAWGEVEKGQERSHTKSIGLQGNITPRYTWVIQQAVGLCTHLLRKIVSTTPMILSDFTIYWVKKKRGQPPEEDGWWAGTSPTVLWESAPSPPPFLLPVLQNNADPGSVL